jgi:hypothetical protein
MEAPIRWRTRGARGSHSPKIARIEAGDAEPFRPARRAGKISTSAGSEPVRADALEGAAPGADRGMESRSNASPYVDRSRREAARATCERIVVPDVQYSRDGMPNEWHFVHLGSRAVGGAAPRVRRGERVTPEGRITPWDAGIWSQAHARAWKPVADFIRAQGAVPAIQLAHAGRKAFVQQAVARTASRSRPPKADGGDRPSDVAFGHYPAPRAMTVAEIARTVEDFRQAARHSLEAGFDVVEVHGAHGYLLHSVLSPLSNRRTDDYGGDLERRMRFALEYAARIRSEAFSAIMTTGACVLPETRVGMTEQSTTRSRSTPRTRRRASTTAIASSPILHVPAGWKIVCPWARANSRGRRRSSPPQPGRYSSVRYGTSAFVRASLRVNLSASTRSAIERLREVVRRIDGACIGSLDTMRTLPREAGGAGTPRTCSPATDAALPRDIRRKRGEMELDVGRRASGMSRVNIRPG